MAINRQQTGFGDTRVSGGAIESYHTMIRVFGVGGAGNNTLNRLMEMNVPGRGFQTVAVNTDAQDLLGILADKKILIGKNLTGGLGSGGDPEIGERSAEESMGVLTAVIEGTDLLFLTCGLGGGTGTGAIPVIGKLARDKGILTMAIVTMPFSDEGIIRWENAQIGLEKLRKVVDTLIVLRNDKLMEWVPDQPLMKAFQAGDEILTSALNGLSDMILKKGLINLDFADVSIILREGPNAIIGLGESNSENRVEEAVRRAISHPMMETDISGSQSVLVHITAGLDMTLKEARKVIQNVAEKLDPTARIIWGTAIDKNLNQTIRVMLIASGLREKVDKKANGKNSASVEKGNLDTLKAVGRFPKTKELVMDNGKSIFDIKESILAAGTEVSTQTKSVSPITQTALTFYKIFEEEADGDLKRFDRAIHLLREKPENKKALFDARQACKLLHASAQMFGFDEIAQLLSSIEEILVYIQSKELELSTKVLDSITLAMEMVIDLLDNRSDGQGETGYIVDRLRELKEEKLESLDSNKIITES